MNHQENPLTPEHKNERHLSKIYENGIEDLSVIKTRYGNLSLFSDMGLGRSRNEDRVFLDSSRNLFGVVDGMGGYGRGDEAAQIVAEEIMGGIKANVSRDLIQNEASHRMRKNQIFDGGACYVYFQVEKKSAVISFAGDAHLIVIDMKGAIVYTTKGSSLEHAPRGNSFGKISSDVVELMNGSTIIAASDGLWDNVTKDEVVRIVQETPTGKTDQIAKKLFGKAIDGMEHGFMTNYDGMVPDMRKDYGNKDNVSIVVFQKIPPH